jgi:hypothetical protein
MAEEKAQIELELENEVEVEVPEQEQEEAQVEVAQEEDNFDKAESATQKRIDRLTKKMREAERQREEALKYAQSVQAEAQQLKQRMDTLDTSYVQENRLKLSKSALHRRLRLSRRRRFLSLARRPSRADRIRRLKLGRKRTNGLAPMRL